MAGGVVESIWREKASREPASLISCRPPRDKHLSGAGVAALLEAWRAQRLMYTINLQV